MSHASSMTQGQFVWAWESRKDGEWENRQRKVAEKAKRTHELELAKRTVCETDCGIGLDIYTKDIFAHSGASIGGTASFRSGRIYTKDIFSQ